MIFLKNQQSDFLFDSEKAERVKIRVIMQYFFFSNIYEKIKRIVYVCAYGFFFYIELLPDYGVCGAFNGLKTSKNSKTSKIQSTSKWFEI